MLALFRLFLALFLGMDPALAERMTDLDAWRNPIAQVRQLLGASAPPARVEGPGRPS